MCRVPTSSVGFEPGQSGLCAHQLPTPKRGKELLQQQSVGTCIPKSLTLSPLQCQRQSRVNRTSIQCRQVEPPKSRTVGMAESCHAFEENQQQEKDAPNRTEEDTQERVNA